MSLISELQGMYYKAEASLAYTLIVTTLSNGKELTPQKEERIKNMTNAFFKLILSEIVGSYANLLSRAATKLPASAGKPIASIFRAVYLCVCAYTYYQAARTALNAASLAAPKKVSREGLGLESSTIQGEKIAPTPCKENKQITFRQSPLVDVLLENLRRKRRGETVVPALFSERVTSSEIRRCYTMCTEFENYLEFHKVANDTFKFVKVVEHNEEFKLQSIESSP